MKINCTVASKNSNNLELNIQHVGHVQMGEISPELAARLTPGQSVVCELSLPAEEDLPEVVTKSVDDMTVEERAKHMTSTPHEVAKSMVLDGEASSESSVTSDSETTTPDTTEAETHGGRSKKRHH